MKLLENLFINKNIKSGFIEYLKYKFIRIFLSLMKNKDEYTVYHCKRVMKLAVGYAKHYNYPAQKVNTLKYASLLHDMGKIIVPKKILNKSDKLDKNEYTKIKKHPNTGFFIIKKTVFLKKEAAVIKYHHERVDGNGYPSGLKGHEINELSKILSVCDAFDAMTNNRVYRKKLTFEDALKELNTNAGSQFDKDIVELFDKYVKSKTHFV